MKEKTTKGFYVLRDSHYFIEELIPKGIKDIITIGIYFNNDPDQCINEFSIRWEENVGVCVKCFSDALIEDSVFNAYKDVLAILNKMPLNPSVTRVKEELIKNGYQNLTNAKEDL